MRAAQWKEFDVKSLRRGETTMEDGSEARKR